MTLSTRPTGTPRTGILRVLPRITPKTNIGKVVATGLLSAIVFVIGWTIVSGAFGAILFPGPLATLESAFNLVLNGTLFDAIGISLSRILMGYVLGVLAGMCTGVVLAQFAFLDRLLMPILSLGRMVPPTGMIPLAIIWFGIGEASKYFIVFWGCVLVIFLSTYDGMKRVPQTRIWAAQCLGASRTQIVWEVVFPSSIPTIWTGARTSLGLAFMGVVAAEMIGAQSGIGFMLMQARILVQVPQMFVALFTLALCGLLVDAVFVRVGRFALHRYLDFYDKS